MLTISTDRQTDRQTDLTGIHTIELLEQEHMRNRKHKYQWETEKILGIHRYGSDYQKYKGGTITNIESSVELANILNQRTKSKSGGSNIQLAKILGWFTRDKDNPIKANVPSGERSRFSQARYKFMLYAPFEISSLCCRELKKNVAHIFAKETGMYPITAQMACESGLRKQAWLKSGCNAFHNKHPISNPMAFWTEQDVLQYIYINKLPISPVYGEVVIDYKSINQIEGQLNLAEYGFNDGSTPIYKTTKCKRTGCFACLYGAHHEKAANSRLAIIPQVSNPKILDWMLRGGAFDIDGMWKPKGGLGYWFILEWCNVHGGMKYYIPNREYYIEKYSTKETRKYLEKSIYE